MDYYVIRGGARLDGTVEISGAKNAALPILAACVMADGPTVLHAVPHLTDIDCMASLLREVGCRVERSRAVPVALAGMKGRTSTAPSREGALTVEVVSTNRCEAPADLVNSMRASISILGPLLAARGRAVVPLPGGCKFGTRPIDLHVKGLEKLGARFELEDGCVVGTVPGGRLRGTTMYLGGTSGPTVLGTINIMSAATLADGQTRIVGAACEPEVADCAALLNKMGAKIRGAGTPEITIDGVTKLRGCEHTIIPDRIEAGTFMIAAAITGGQLTLRHVNVDHLVAFTHLLESCGVLVHPRGADEVLIVADGRPKPTDTTTWPYPGFPTDLQAPLMALLSLADGNSVITERIYAERFGHAGELTRMGANIRVNTGTAFVTGVEQLTGATVAASDLRAGGALVLAGLAARGTTVVESIHHIDRGYERFDEKLAACGARIERAVQKPRISVAVHHDVLDRAVNGDGTSVVA